MKVLKKLEEYFRTASKDQLIEDETILTNSEIYELYEYIKKLEGNNE